MGQKAATQTLRWQFTVDDFVRMGESGIFREGDRVELIEGEVRAMSPIGARHAAIVNRLNRLLSDRSRGTAIISIQNPVRLSRYTEPQPDITILRFRDDYYAGAHPVPADVLVLIEVADFTLDYDRDEKTPLYAQEGLAEVWLVDVDAETVLVSTDPAPRGYRRSQSFRRGDAIESRQLAALNLDVNDIFGEPAPQAPQQ